MDEGGGGPGAAAGAGARNNKTPIKNKPPHSTDNTPPACSQPLACHAAADEVPTCMDTGSTAPPEMGQYW